MQVADKEAQGRADGDQGRIATNPQRGLGGLLMILEDKMNPLRPHVLCQVKKPGSIVKAKRPRPHACLL